MKQNNSTKISVSKKLIVDQLKKIPIVQIVCEKMGVSRATYYRWRKKYTKFRLETDKAIIEGRLLINDMAESQLITAIKDQKMPAILFWLRSHHKAYANKVEMKADIESKGKLTNEQKVFIREALKKANLSI